VSTKDVNTAQSTTWSTTSSIQQQQWLLHSATPLLMTTVCWVDLVSRKSSGGMATSPFTTLKKRVSLAFFLRGERGIQSSLVTAGAVVVLHNKACRSVLHGLKMCYVLCEMCVPDSATIFQYRLDK
jgi:hypothetical protein